jgi:hypothetical protein
MSAAYLFGPLERRGVFLGARLGQIVVLLTTTTLVVGILNVAPSLIGAALSVSVVLCGGASMLVPFAGRTVEEWAPVVVGFLGRRVTGSDRWVDGNNLAGHSLVGTAGLSGREVSDSESSGPKGPQFHIVSGPGSQPPVSGDDRTADLTAGRLVRAVCAAGAGAATAPYLRSIRLLAAHWGAGEVGVLADARGRTYTAVLALGGSSLALADDAQRRQRLSLWGAVLAGIGREGGAVTRVQWIERTSANDSGAAIGHLHDHRVVEVSNPLLHSYLSLLNEGASHTQHHEVLLAVQVSAARASATIRRLRAGADVGACEALSHELLTLADGLRQADTEVRGVLSPRMLAGHLRCAADPAAQELLAQPAGAHGELAGAAPATALPRRSRASWSTFRTEGGLHATYWVAEWPLTPVGSRWISPLLLGTRCRRTVSVVMQPCRPGRALRQVEAARVDDETTASFRQRLGFHRTVRRQREAENLARAEQELNEGHQHIALSAYLTVSAATDAELAASCREVEQRAALAQLDIRREYGTQDVAFTYSLPLCRGLR